MFIRVFFYSFDTKYHTLFYVPRIFAGFPGLNLQLAGPNMLSTQVQALVRECFAEVGTPFHRQLRRDMIAVR